MLGMFAPGWAVAMSSPRSGWYVSLCVLWVSGVLHISACEPQWVVARSSPFTLGMFAPEWAIAGISLCSGSLCVSVYLWATGVLVCCWEFGHWICGIYTHIHLHEKHVHSTLAKQKETHLINPRTPYKHHIHVYTECPALRTGNGGLKIFDGTNSPMYLFIRVELSPTGKSLTSSQKVLSSNLRNSAIKGCMKHTHLSYHCCGIQLIWRVFNTSIFIIDAFLYHVHCTCMYIYIYKYMYIHMSTCICFCDVVANIFFPFYSTRWPPSTYQKDNHVLAVMVINPCTCTHITSMWLIVHVHTSHVCDWYPEVASSPDSPLVWPFHPSKL